MQRESASVSAVLVSRNAEKKQEPENKNERDTGEGFWESHDYTKVWEHVGVGEDECALPQGRPHLTSTVRESLENAERLQPHCQIFFFSC